MLEDILERKIANEVAEFAGQFFGHIQDGDRSTAPHDTAHSGPQHPQQHHIVPDMAVDADLNLEDMSTPNTDG